MADENKIEYDALTNFTGIKFGSGQQRQATQIEAVNALMSTDMSVRITVPSGSDANRRMITIPAFLTREISISGMGNDWQNLLDFGPFQELIGTLNSVVNLLNTFATAEGDGTTGAAQVSMQSRHMTAASWKASKLPTFSVPLTFLSLAPEQNPLDTFLALARCVLPNSYQETEGANQSRLTNNIANGMCTAASTGISVVNRAANALAPDRFNKVPEEDINSYVNNMIKGGILEAPCGYNLNALDPNEYLSPRKNTTLELRVGRWLHASKLLVTSLGNVSVSRQTIKGSTTDGQRTGWGNPLYVTCTLELRPYKMITFKEFLNYFPTAQRRENE